MLASRLLRGLFPRRTNLIITCPSASFSNASPKFSDLSLHDLQNLLESSEPAASSPENAFQQEFDYASFSGRWNQFKRTPSRKYTAYQPIPQVESQKLRIIEQFKGTLTAEELRYLQYQIALRQVGKIRAVEETELYGELLEDIAKEQRLMADNNDKREIQRLKLIGKEKIGAALK